MQGRTKRVIYIKANTGVSKGVSYTRDKLYGDSVNAMQLWLLLYEYKQMHVKMQSFKNTHLSFHEPVKNHEHVINE